MTYSEDILNLNPELAEIKTKKPVKYRNIRTYSTMCRRCFASKREAKRAEELKLLEHGGEISDLKYQVKFKLCDAPKISYTADFTYLEKGRLIVEDVKGVLTRETRVKLAWLKEKTGVDVLLTK